METYDDAAFDQFCSALVDAGFSPVRNTGQAMWTGPIRESLKPLTDATRMQVWFPQGWPLRYAHVTVDRLKTEHAAHGTICLWADDDPAQVAARDPAILWARLDEWAQVAQRGFRMEDRSLDAYLLFEESNNYQAELPFGDLIRAGSNGYCAPLIGTRQGRRAIMLKPLTQAEQEPAEEHLRGAFYLRNSIGTPPRNLDDIAAALTKKQKVDLARGLAERAATALAEPSGGFDFIVLAWPRHDREHDAVVLGFEGQGDSLRASAMSATPNETIARMRRAGPEVELLATKTVLVAGAGSVGGHVAVTLAASGINKIRLHDDDYLKTGNLVRHVSNQYLVGYPKTLAVSMTIDDHAPWTKVDTYGALPHDPKGLSAAIEGIDLVVDCTGMFSLSAALAHVCHRTGTPLITGAIFHEGAIARVQRQAKGDTPIGARPADTSYLKLPREDPTEPSAGFLELGCTAPINNAPPTAVLGTATDIAHAAVDYLTGHDQRADERILVFQAMELPFDRTGIIDSSGSGGAA